MIINKIVRLSFLIGVAGFSFAQTQPELNNTAKSQLQKVEKKLRETVSKIKLLYKSEPAFLKSLDEAQTAWEKFKYAQMKMKFPENEKNYGSVFPMCAANYSISLIEERIKELQEWISGTEEGDVCAGSVRFKSN